MKINHSIHVGKLKIARLFIETQSQNWGKHNPFVISLDLGNGAGYIRGCTLFLAHHSGSANWKHRFRAIPYPLFGIELGITRNGNRVPYLSH